MNTILAAISGQALLNAVIWIIVAAVIFWLVTWLIGYVGLPEPFAKVARVIVGIAAVLFLINALLTLAGKPLITF
jgi:uncharacterized membrane protein YuzA (DUF378 family)